MGNNKSIYYVLGLCVIVIGVVFISVKYNESETQKYKEQIDREMKQEGLNERRELDSLILNNIRHSGTSR